jgi:intracellular septation protein
MKYVVKALVPIVRDLLGALLFLTLVYTADIYTATATGVSVILAQTIYMHVRRHRIGALHWLSLILITVFGGATILFHSQYFIMLKPSLLWLAIAIIMLRRDWLAPYLPPIITDNLDDRLIVQAGYAYSALMFALSAADLIVVWFVWVGLVTEKFWVVYAVTVPTAAQGVLWAVFYLIFRKQISARIQERKAQTA